MIQPKVTVILPVYNVETYLRQCLDSVVNQTMREIQIICVNDGATDTSPAILQEYAAKDSRIEIIHQKNQGGGSARNAAYPHICGKYAYFVDPDDWIDLDLCQQCWNAAETTEADIVTLQYIEHRSDSPPTQSRPFNSTSPEIRQSPEEKHEVFRDTSTFWRFWRSSFLLSNNIRFSEGKRPNNDVLAAWKGTVLANRIAVLDNPLYHYRIRSDSYQQTCNEKHFMIVETFSDIHKMLHETGWYETYKDFFFVEKLRHCLRNYWRFPSSLRSPFLKHIRQSRTEDERAFYRTAPMNLMPKTVWLFHKVVDGGPMATVSHYLLIIYIKMWKLRLFQWTIKRIKL
ncbi:MAG: glycosyltransferase [Phycisphaerales bacterium]|nr:glycosyltransferase [Phycisphaerales bacterium]